MFALLASLAALLAVSSMAAPPTTGSSASFAARDGRWLAAQLKIIVDRAELYAPEEVARTLALELEPSEKQITRPPGDCTRPVRGGTRSLSKTSYRPTGSWYKPTRDGVQRMEVPESINNPATTIGDPTIDYDIYRSVACDGISGLLHETNAALGLGGLSSFTCFTPKMLKDWINADFRVALHGYAHSEYRGASNEQFGISLEFGFKMGAPCAFGASIRQEQRSGLRYQRTWAKFRDCIERAEKAHCAEKPDATSSDLYRVTRAAEVTCGGFESLYQNEASTGQAPPARPEYCFDSDKPACQSRVPCTK